MNRRALHTARTAKGNGKRLDIQGLRAVAVLMVVFDHLFDWPSGGFAGVDVFFVLSGFLITGLLLREWEREDAISVTHFYARRIKRILPAALTVIVATLIAARFILTGSRVHDLNVDGLYAAVFGANWRFASTGTDYFNQGAATSALQHYWSLSVEEQFYFVVPWVMLALLLAIGNAGFRKRWDRRGAAALIGALTIGSFVWAMLQSTSSPTVAYFSSFTRAWELGVGALLACVAPALRHIPAAARKVLAWVGIAGIVASMFVLDSSTTWPAPGAVLPVVATAVVIAAGTGAPAPGNVLLTNPAATYVGDISYSLYLWHFPVVVLYGEYETNHNTAFYAAAIVMMAVLSVGSFHAIERPLNTSPLLTRFPSPELRRVAWRGWREDVRTSMLGGGLALLVALTGISVAGGVSSANASVDPATPPIVKNSVAADTAPATETKLQDGLTAALAATSWPKLNPSIDSLPDAGQAPGGAECSTDVVDHPDACRYGSSSHPKMVIYGDSLGPAVMPTVRAAYGSTYQIKGLSQTSCAITDLKVDWKSDAERDACLRHRSKSIPYIKAQRPDVLIVVQNYNWSTRLSSKATGLALAVEWRAADVAFAKKVKPYVKHVLFMSSPPTEKHITDCATKNSTPADCVTPVADSYKTIHTVEAAGVPGAKFVDTLPWFCVQGQCPAFNGTLPVQIDGTHPTRQYSSSPGVVADFKRQMKDAGVS